MIKVDDAAGRAWRRKLLNEGGGEGAAGAASGAGGSSLRARLARSVITLPHWGSRNTPLDPPSLPPSTLLYELVTPLLPRYCPPLG